MQTTIMVSCGGEGNHGIHRIAARWLGNDLPLKRGGSAAPSAPPGGDRVRADRPHRPATLKGSQSIHYYLVLGDLPGVDVDGRRAGGMQEETLVHRAGAQVAGTYRGNPWKALRLQRAAPLMTDTTYINVNTSISMVYLRLLRSLKLRILRILSTSTIPRLYTVTLRSGFSSRRRQCCDPAQHQLESSLSYFWRRQEPPKPKEVPQSSSPHPCA